jgi:hypothetical protein
MKPLFLMKMKGLKQNVFINEILKAPIKSYDLFNDI